MGKGYLLLTEKQVKQVAEGKMIIIYRSGEALTIGLKTKHTEAIRIKAEIETLKRQLRDINANGNAQ